MPRERFRSASEDRGLREVFVPGGEAIDAIAWSADGHEVIVTTRGPMYAVDTQTWRIEPSS